MIILTIYILIIIHFENHFMHFLQKSSSYFAGILWSFYIGRSINAKIPIFFTIIVKKEIIGIEIFLHFHKVPWIFRCISKSQIFHSIINFLQTFSSRAKPILPI